MSAATSAEGYVYDDGGREAAGFKSTTGDCVTRAVSIATQQPYKVVYEALNELAKAERPRGQRKRSNACTGVHKQTIRRYMESIGWTWTPTTAIGSGCTVHLRADGLPAGRLVVALGGSRVLCVNCCAVQAYDRRYGPRRRTVRVRAA
jgi:hypothetical protein